MMIREETTTDEVYYFYPTIYDYADSFELELRELIKQVQLEIDYNWISCFVFDPITNSLEKMDMNEEGFNLIDNIRFDNGFGLSGWVAEQQRPVLLSSVHRGQRFRSNPVKSFICCPVIRSGITIGVLNLGHIRTNSYNRKILNRLLEIVNP